MKDALQLDRKEKKKAQHPAGFKPTTSGVLLLRRVLYCCATTAAQKKLNAQVTN